MDRHGVPGFWGLGYAGQRLGIDPKSGKIIIKFSYQSSRESDQDLFRLFCDWSNSR